MVASKSDLHFRAKAVVAVLVAVAVAAGCVGLYLWLDNEDDERERAEVAANEFAAYYTRIATRKCTASQLEPLADDAMWLFHVDCGQGSRCMALDLDHFRKIPSGMYVGGRIEGVSESACSPELWTDREATARFRESEWAKHRQAQFVSCSGRTENPYAFYAREFVCRFNTKRGEGDVVIRTTGPDTFEIEPSR